MLKINSVCPDFHCKTSEGDISFHEWLGDSWGVLFSHPKDFTPVCTTELGSLGQMKAEFDARNVKVIGLSVDGVEDHKKWLEDIKDVTGTKPNYPIIADPDKKIAEMYDMIHPNALNNLTVRSVFIIAPDKTVKLTLTYPASTGRNFDEILRVIDSLQLTANYQVATPVDWKHGDDCVVVPAIKTEDIPEKFPKGHKVIKPYLRTTPQPNL